MTTTTRRTAALAIALTLTPGAPRPAEAQLEILSGVGYGTLGAATGLLLTSGAECTGSQFICIPPAMVVAGLTGLTVGTVLGAKIAKAAERSADRGEPADHLGAVAFGATVGGGVVTMMIADRLFDRDDGTGTFLGSEERSAAVFGVAGAAATIVYLRSRWSELSGSSVEVAPAVVGGEAGVSMRIRF